MPQIRELWRRIGKDCGWEHPRAALRWLWKDDAVGAVVGFLEGTRVDSRASAEMARARMVKTEAERKSWVRRARRTSQARPSMYFAFFSLVPFYYLFLWSGGLGIRRKGCPSITHSGWGQGKVMYGGGEKAAVREGSGKPLPWPFGPHAAR